MQEPTTCLNRPLYPCPVCPQGITVREAIWFIDGKTITPIPYKLPALAKKRSWGRDSMSVCSECGAAVKGKYNGYIIYACVHGEARREQIKERKRNVNAQRRRAAGIPEKAETRCDRLVEKVCSDCGVPKPITEYYLANRPYCRACDNRRRAKRMREATIKRKEQSRCFGLLQESLSGQVSL
jgi:hypothetical protein